MKWDGPRAWGSRNRSGICSWDGCATSALLGERTDPKNVVPAAISALANVIKAPATVQHVGPLDLRGLRHSNLHEPTPPPASMIGIHRPTGGLKRQLASQNRKKAHRISSGTSFGA